MIPPTATKITGLPVSRRHFATSSLASHIQLITYRCLLSRLSLLAFTDFQKVSLSLHCPLPSSDAEIAEADY